MIVWLLNTDKLKLLQGQMTKRLAHRTWNIIVSSAVSGMITCCSILDLAIFTR